MDMPNSGRVTLQGYLEVPEHRIDEVARLLPEHVDLTRRESGCLLFELAFSTDIAGRLLVHEVFENRQAFDAHQARTRKSRWFQASRDIPRHYTVSTDGTG